MSHPVYSRCCQSSRTPGHVCAIKLVNTPKRMSTSPLIPLAWWGRVAGQRTRYRKVRFLSSGSALLLSSSQSDSLLAAPCRSCPEVILSGPIRRRCCRSQNTRYPTPPLRCGRLSGDEAEFWYSERYGEGSCKGRVSTLGPASAGQANSFGLILISDASALLSTRVIAGLLELVTFQLTGARSVNCGGLPSLQFSLNCRRLFQVMPEDR
jgi:hypothetical protein